VTVLLVEDDEKLVRAVPPGLRHHELTAREFAVLEYLARHPGEAVTRARLLEHVWDVVDVYVGDLRKRIDQPSEPLLIRTLRGVGWMPEPSA
jgi:DNA-binding response OmpR family regulator